MIVLAVFLTFAVAIGIYLVRQRRFYAATPRDLRRVDAETRDNYSVYEQGHDIATSYVERGGQH